MVKVFTIIRNFSGVFYFLAMIIEGVGGCLGMGWVEACEQFMWDLFEMQDMVNRLVRMEYCF